LKQEIRFNSPTPSEYDSVFSNFVASVVLLDGLEYPTVEHAYQAAKTLDQESLQLGRHAQQSGIGDSRVTDSR